VEINNSETGGASLETGQVPPIEQQQGLPLGKAILQETDLVKPGPGDLVRQSQYVDGGRVSNRNSFADGTTASCVQAGGATDLSVDDRDINGFGMKVNHGDGIVELYFMGGFIRTD
jgi:hypothetical protein